MPNTDILVEIKATLDTLHTKWDAADRKLDSILAKAIHGRWTLVIVGLAGATCFAAGALIF